MHSFQKNATFCVLLCSFAKERYILCVLLRSLQRKERIFLLGLISRQKLEKKRKRTLRALKERKRMMRSERKRTRCPTLGLLNLGSAELLTVQLFTEKIIIIRGQQKIYINK